MSNAGKMQSIFHLKKKKKFQIVKVWIQHTNEYKQAYHWFFK